MYNEGQRPIAFSQEYLKWSDWGGNGYFEAGDIVTLVSTDYPSDPRCNGEFIVSDAMNAKWRHRGDIFFLDRSDNLSCHANVLI